MGLMDSFPFSLGSFAILDDLDYCSSDDDTYVERRGRPSASRTKSSSAIPKSKPDDAKSKARSKSKPSEKPDARSLIASTLAHEAASRRAASTTTVTRKETETVRGSTVVEKNPLPAQVKGEETNTRRSLAPLNSNYDTSTVASISVKPEGTRRRSSFNTSAVAAIKPERERSISKQEALEAERERSLRKSTSRRENEGKSTREEGEMKRSKSTSQKENKTERREREREKKEDKPVEKEKKDTVRSMSRSRSKHPQSSRMPSPVPVPLVASTSTLVPAPSSTAPVPAPSSVPPLAPQPEPPVPKPTPSEEAVRRENRALRRRTERLERDLAAYRRHTEHYREQRAESERARVAAEERAAELEVVVANMRESYELELEDLRGKMAEVAAKKAGSAAAEKVYAGEGSDAERSREEEERDEVVVVERERDGELTEEIVTVRELEHSVRAPSRRDIRSRVPTVREAPSEHNPSIHPDTTPAPAPVLYSHPTTPHLAPVPVPFPPTTEDSRGASTLLAQLDLRDAELRALRQFHSETPQIPLEDLTASVNALNSDIHALAAALAHSVPLGRTWEAAQAWALEAAEPALARCLRLLAGVKGADFAKDLTLVRLALQSWIVECLQRVFGKFLFGLEDAEDEMLRRVFKRVQARETLPVAARWRALARRHARTLAAPPVSSAPLATFSAAQDHAIHLLEMDILVGAEALLRFAGAHSPPGVLLQELSAAHGRRITRLVRRTARLARNLAERAPAGCEIFTVTEGGDTEHGKSGDEEQGLFFCGCMEDVDQECRRWVGKTERHGRVTRTHTRANTVRSKSRTARSKAHTAHTATTRTWADTNIRYWDRDDSDDELDDSDEESEEVEEDGEEDEFVDGLGGKEGENAHPAVVCSLGFGLRRILRRPKRKTGRSGQAALGGAAEEHRSHHEEELQRERRRGVQAEVETIHGSASDVKSSYTKLTTSSSSTATSLETSSATSSGTARQRLAPAGTERSAGQGTSRKGAEDSTGTSKEVEVLVKTDVLLSSTVDSLQRRFMR